MSRRVLSLTWKNQHSIYNMISLYMNKYNITIDTATSTATATADNNKKKNVNIRTAQRQCYQIQIKQVNFQCLHWQIAICFQMCATWFNGITRELYLLVISSDLWDMVQWHYQRAICRLYYQICATWFSGITTELFAGYIIRSVPHGLVALPQSYLQVILSDLCHMV